MSIPVLGGTAGGAPAAQAWNDVLALAAHAREAAAAWLFEGLSTAPALMLGLAAALALAVLALAASAAAALRRHRRRRRLIAAVQAAGDAQGATQTAEVWLRAGDGAAFRVAADRPLARIGRHEDNEVRLSADTVHRYHALVHHNPEGELWLVDLSGPDGNGVRVNGVRVAKARIAPGDRIEIGNEPLVLERGPGERAPPRPATGGDKRQSVHETAARGLG